MQAIHVYGSEIDVTHPGHCTRGQCVRQNKALPCVGIHVCVMIAVF